MQGSVFYISKSRKYYMPRIKEMVKSIQIYPFTGTRMLDKVIKVFRKSSKRTWENMFYITLSKKSRRKHCNKQDLKEKKHRKKKT